MRPPSLLAVVAVAAALTATPASAIVVKEPAAQHHRHTFSSRHPSIDRSVATRIRDSAIQWIWGPPPPGEIRQSVLESPSLDSVQDPSLRHNGDVVLRFNISSAEEATALAEVANDLFLDIWEHTREWVDMRIAKDAVPLVIAMLPESLHNAHSLLMHDLGQAVRESFPDRSDLHATHFGPNEQPSFSHAHLRAPEQSNVFFRDYQPLSVIHPWMRLMQSLFPTHVRLISLGQSAEGRELLALRVGAHPTNAAQPHHARKTIIVSGGAHAREWISTAAVTYGAYALITRYGRSAEVTKLVDAFDWVFVPTLNPDGYVYTWEHDRLWRKNRQATTLRFCKGLDLDRSFPFAWDGAATRGNPCSEAYAGEAPLEAVEAVQLASWIRNETDSGSSWFVGFLDLHSYSQQVLYPYSYSCIKTPPTLETLEELGLGLAKSMRLAGRRTYDVTSACEGSVVGSSSPAAPSLPVWPRIESGGGSALDYMYHTAGVRYAYQIKLRDRGSYGFLLPSRDIVPSGQEVEAAVTYFGRFLLSDKGIERSIDEIKTPSEKSPEDYFRAGKEEEHVDGEEEERFAPGNGLEL